MPPTGYLSAAGVESAVLHIANQYPSLAARITLPEQSWGGRAVNALRLRAGTGHRRGVLLIGGVHARELINPDMLVGLALRLCQAYTAKKGLSFGGKAYSAGSIKLIMEALDLLVLPLVNPDGRAHVQSPSGYAMWRKNRRPNPGGCAGVDLNRNYDFLFSSGIGTSADACSDVFKGPAAFSEPETRNVRHLLDAYPNVTGLIDVHSYAQKILHSWGDDDTQTTNTAMTFQNPAFNGLRGTPGDTLYKEYMPAKDRDWLVDAGKAMRDAIKAVRGTSYLVQPAVMLYPTSGTSKDYAYARHFVQASKRRVYAYTVETATEFQPPYSEALRVIDEVSAGLVQFCLSSLCIADAPLADSLGDADRDGLRTVRDEVLEPSVTGRRLAALGSRHAAELNELAQTRPAWRARAIEILAEGHQAVAPSEEAPRRMPEALVAKADALIGEVLEARGSTRASARLAADLRRLRHDLGHLAGRPLDAGLAAADAADRTG